MIYRGPSFLTVVRFGSTPAPNLPLFLSVSWTGDEHWEREILCWQEGGRGRAWSWIIEPQETLVLYKSLNPLWKLHTVSLFCFTQVLLLYTVYYASNSLRWPPYYLKIFILLLSLFLTLLYIHLLLNPFFSYFCYGYLYSLLFITVPCTFMLFLLQCIVTVHILPLLLSSFSFRTSNIKGTVSREGYFLEGLNILISIFCVWFYIITGCFL